MKFLAAAFVAVAAVGCAGGLPTFADSPRVERTTARIAVHQAVFAFVRQDSDKAARVVAVANQIIATSEDADVTIDTLRAAIPWNEMNPQQRLDAEALLDLVVYELLARVPEGDQQLPIEDVKVVAGWVREAAVIFIPSP